MSIQPKANRLVLKGVDQRASRRVTKTSKGSGVLTEFGNIGHKRWGYMTEDPVEGWKGLRKSYEESRKQRKQTIGLS